MLAAVWSFVTQNQAYLMGLLYLIINEVLAANPNAKSNSVIQFLLSLIGYTPKTLAPPSK